MDPRQSRWRWRLVLLFVSAVICDAIAPLRSQQQLVTTDEDYVEPTSSRSFRWNDIEPSEKLVYTSCYDSFQCARLRVPMDWNTTGPDPETIAIAIIKLPAKVPVTDRRYGGPILINPGGGSGVYFALTRAKALQTVVDAAYKGGHAEYVAPNGSYFDIISFDPRGVNNTTPFHTCFTDQKDVLEWAFDAGNVLGTDEAPFALLWAKSLANGKGCANISKIANYVSTPMVVRDMVEIIERHGEWREAEADLSSQTSQVPIGFPETYESLKWSVGKEPLNYWGFSYGTVLGSTFAAMEPSRARRLVLDGVADADDYFYGGWTSNLQDSDHVMDHFFDLCSAAGPDACAMHTGNSPEDIRQRWDALVNRISTLGPVPVPGNAERGPEIITLSDIKKLVNTATYQPLQKFDEVSDLMADLSRGTGSKFADYKHQNRVVPTVDTSCEYIDPTRPECHTANLLAVLDAGTAILCTDGNASFTKLSQEEFKHYWNELKAQSSWVGDIWARIRLNCIGWEGRAAWKYSGPVSSNATSPNSTLFVGNTYDNVTPIRNARKMAAQFRGSGLLQVDIDGHTTEANPSLCAGRSIRRYFQTGELPETGTVCLPHSRPFLREKAPGVEPLPQHMDRETSALLDALKSLSAE